MLSRVLKHKAATFVDKAMTVSVIIPALNEQDSIASVVNKVQRQLVQSGFDNRFEIIVADNNSTDDTAQVAQNAGAKVIHEPRPGYGAACWSACGIARGEILLFVDADGATEPADSVRLIRDIQLGADLVIGVRENPQAGSMSASQIFGNWLACNLLRFFWRIRTADLGPHRAIRRSSFDAMAMQDRGFGWTVEMQIKAAIQNCNVKEIPVNWYAREQGQSKIGGTLVGVFKAGIGILGMIVRMRRKYPVVALKQYQRHRQAAIQRSSIVILENTLQHPIEERKTL